MTAEENPQGTAPPPSSVDISISAPALDVVEGTLNSFLQTASVNRVFSEPVRHGDTLLIPSAEVLVGLGFGAGYGFGSDKAREEKQGAVGGGGGGGGGGRTLSRPVAVIVATPQGVRIEPVVDVTKVAIAAITAAGFMLATMYGILNPRHIARHLKGD